MDEFIIINMFFKNCYYIYMKESFIYVLLRGIKIKFFLKIFICRVYVFIFLCRFCCIL